jgi:hypothetical protein
MKQTSKKEPYTSSTNTPVKTLSENPTLEEVRALAGPDDIVEQTPEGEIMVRVGAKNPKKYLRNSGLADITATDVSSRHIEQMARGFIMGSTSISNNRQIRQKLEDRVTKRIGSKGKFLVDKLFELAEGVYVVDKVGGKDIRYYKVPPHFPALVYLMDRVLGKPKAYLEKSEEKKGIYVVEHIIKGLATPKKVESVDVTATS